MKKSNRKASVKDGQNVKGASEICQSDGKGGKNGFFKKTVSAAAQGLLEQGGIEISSDRRAVVDGCRAVEEYDSDFIRLSLGKRTVIFRGRELVIDCFERNRAEISGIFTSLEFE